MTRSAKQVASQVSVEAPPPYTEASSDAQPSWSARSDSSSLPTEGFVNPTPFHFVDLRAASLRISTKLQKNAQPCERQRPPEDSVTPSSAAETARDAAADVPPGVHLVQSPYKLRHKNSSLIRDILVFGGDPIDTFVPDVTLRTKNALLHSAVYINDEKWGRPVSIHARTKNADLIISVQPQQTGQAVRVRASTKNGRSRIFLPREFKGLLAVSTKNGKCTLSADLKKVAVRVPSRYKEMLKIDESFGRRDSSEGMFSNVPNELGNGVDVWYEINGNGPSVALVDTKNGNVWAGFNRDDEVGCWPNCSLM